jgi:hypothetical protein
MGQGPGGQGLCGDRRLGGALKRLDAPVILKITPLPMDDHLGHGERSVKRGGILGKQATAQKGQGCMLCARCPGNAAAA